MDTKQLSWRLALCAAAGVAGLMLTACADTGSEEVSAAPTWSEMTASGGTLSACQTCHGDPASSAQGGLSLAADQYTAVLAATTSVCTGASKVVDVGHHASSVLYLVAVGDSSCSGVPAADLPMPGGPAAAPQISSWIDSGAPQ